MPLPTTDMPGHAGLHERVTNALGSAVETPEVEFKESLPWEELKLKLVKAVLGIGNLRDGGLLIVGIAGRDLEWSFDGCPPELLAAYDQDLADDALRTYVSGQPKATVVLHTPDGGPAFGATFVIFDIEGFRTTPLVCRKNGPDEDTNGLRNGSVYFRPREGRVRTEAVSRSEDMQEMLEVAAEKGTRRQLALIGRLGLLPATPAEPTDAEAYDEELGDL